MRLSIIVILFCCSCSNPNTNLGTSNYYFNKSGLRSNILCKIEKCNKFSEIFSTVLNFKVTKDFIVVFQKPNFEQYLMDLAMFLNSRKAIYLNDKNCGTVKHKYWTDFSDSISYNLIIPQHIQKEEQSNTIKYQQYVYKIADSLIKNNPFHKSVFTNTNNYWIVDLKKDSLHGPFQKDEFSLKKLDFGISTTLKLDDEEIIN